MSEKVIFLSYRRGDSPGYVKSLEKELEQYYGKGRVFRDVQDIPGGSKWKQELERNIRNSAVVLLVIGPRWDTLWRERIDDPVNYVEYELNYAHDFGVPVIPLTLGGAMISNDTDLKSVSWIRENQIYDMSDKQSRWENDLKGLLQLLENYEGLGSPKNIESTVADTAVAKSGSPLKKIAIAAAGIFAGLLLLSSLMPGPNPQSVPQAPRIEPNIAPTPTEEVIETVVTATKPKVSKATARYPNLSGTWHSSIDGGLLKFSHDGSQNFTIFASDYGSFVGRFVDNQPGKIRIVLNAGGSGEFSLSNSSEKLIGWVIYDDGSKDYGTLTKVQ